MRLEQFVQDVRLAVRLMIRFRGSTVAAVATLALCIGATTAIFSLVQAVLLRPLPYGNPERLIVVWSAAGHGETTHISSQELRSYRQDTASLEQLGGYIESGASFTDGEAPERVRAAHVTTDLFRLLDVPAAYGRTFTDRDAAPDAPRTVILGYGVWMRQYGANPAIIGNTIRVSGTLRTVIGVMPEGFRLPLDYRATRPTEAWYPIALETADSGQWGDRSMTAIGRLKEGADPHSATGEFAVISDRWIRAGFVTDQGDSGLRRAAVPLNRVVTAGAGRAVLIVFGAVGVVLLMACVTVANLLTARAALRRPEMAVRAALGAPRGRIARQLLTESLLLAMLSGALAMLVAQTGIRALKSLPAATMPRAEGASLNLEVFIFAAAVALGTGLLFGMLPALQLSRPDLNAIMNESGRGDVGRRTRRLRRTLVAAEIALAVMLVVGAGLLLRSLFVMYRIELGFNPHRVLTAQTTLLPSDYPDDADVVRTIRQLEMRLERVPGVRAAGAVRILPLARPIGDWSIVIEGRPHVREENPNTDFQSATPGYFKAMEIHAVRGRLLAPSDDERSPMVAVINETMAQRYWPGEDPIGKRFHLSTGTAPWLTIVGIIRTVRHNAIIEAPRAEAYLPHAQVAREIGAAFRTMTLVVRTASEPAGMVAAVRTAVREVAPQLPLAELQSMEQVTSSALAQPRLTTMLFSLLAGLALILAALGVYSTVSLLVTERTREIGIRVALGARRGSILRLVVTEGAVLIAAGLTVGIGSGLLLTRLLQGLLYGIAPVDPVTFAAVPAVLGVLAVLACLNPARRATSVDPVVALRDR